MPKSSDIDRKFYDSHTEIEIDRKSIIEEDVKGWYFDSAGAHAAAHNTVIDFYSKKYKRSIAFKAIITSFNDNYNQTYSSDKVGMNVMVQKLTYTGKKRTINLSFDVFASSEKEAEANLRRINELALYAHSTVDTGDPSDGPADKGGEGNFADCADQKADQTKVVSPKNVKIKFCNLIAFDPDGDTADQSGLECVINTLSYDFSTEHTYYKISQNKESTREKLNKNVHIAPTKLSVTLSLDVVEAQFDESANKIKKRGSYGTGFFREKPVERLDQSTASDPELKSRINNILKS